MIQNAVTLNHDTDSGAERR